MTDTALPVDNTPVVDTPAAVEDNKPMSLDEALDKAFATTKVDEARVKDEEQALEKKRAAREPAPEGNDKRVRKSFEDLDDIFDKVEAKVAADEKAKEKSRDENGKFKAKEDTAPKADTPSEKDEVEADDKVDESDDSKKDDKAAEEVADDIKKAPSRFKKEAQAEWDKLPDVVKAETHRAIQELTEGHKKYKAEAELFKEVEVFHKAAVESGTTLKQALENYTTYEAALRERPLEGLEKIVENLQLTTPSGKVVTLRDIAAVVLNQPEKAPAAQVDAPKVDTAKDEVIESLKKELADLKEQVGQVAKSAEQQEADRQLAIVTAFAAEHPRFDELSDDITLFLSNGRAKDLKSAYELAERLNPAAVVEEKEQDTKDHTPVVEKRKSISGSPSNGSTPKSRQAFTSKSIDEALDRAFASLK